MMAQKNLHELLQEDQEPFQLKNYIADRRCQLKKASSSSPETQQIVVKKRKPISQTTKFPSNICKSACFFSFHESSADPKKSPLFEFPSPVKSPCRSTPNAIVLQIPTRTAALLLEAALKIQKQSSKQKTQYNGSGLFESIRRKLTQRNRTRKRAESSSDGVKVSVKDILRWDSSVGARKSSYAQKHEKVKEQEVVLEDKSAFELGFSCSCNGRTSSAVWSESNEDKSLDLDLETSCSSQSEDFEEEEMEETDFASCEKRFCENPFRFMLQTSPSTGRRTPDFSSPATSPIRPRKEDKESHEIEMIKKFPLEAEDEEKEKEQCSPVSVLDRSFEEDDEDEGHEDEDKDEDENEDGYDLECSYAIVQRAKHQLLHKLRRFEKLAELDPIELEKRILEQEQDGNENVDCDDDLEEEGECEYYHESALSDRQKDVDEFVKEVLSKSIFHDACRIPQDMKRLVADLIAEEEGDQDCGVDRDIVVKRVCRKLDSLKEVESNTIDMMVEQDLRRELDGWKRYQEQVGEAALEIEFAIFGLLMEELSGELVV